VVPVVLAIGACDLKPAPKKQAQAKPAAASPAAAATPAAVPATAVAPASPNADTGAQACLEVGVRVSDIMIASATDAVLRAQYEQARSDIVRATAQSCMNGKWDAALRGCFLAAKTQPELDACKGRVPAPAPAPTPTSALGPTRG